MPNKNIDIIKREASKIGKIEPISEMRDAYRISCRGKSFVMTKKFVLKNQFSTPSSLTKFKDLTNSILDKEGFNIPRFEIVRKSQSVIELKAKLRKLNFPIFIKNTSGSNSRGIFSNIRNQKEALMILKENLGKFDPMILQEMVFGKEYRALVLGDKVIGVLQMMPPHIIGDGKTKTLALIKKLREEAPSKLPLNKKLESNLEQQGESLLSVPKKNKVVYLKNKSSLEEGGMTIDMTDAIHPSFVKILVRATAALGLCLSGIDMMCEDISKSARSQKHWLIEVNGKPDIFIHHNPSRGRSRNVTSKIIRYIVKNL